MKNKIILIAMLFSLLCPAGPSPAEEQGSVRPEVLIDKPVFTFEPVPEGVHVSHEFKIRNTGSALLHIHDVMPP